MTNVWCRSICKCNIDEPKVQIEVIIRDFPGLQGKDVFAHFTDGELFLVSADATGDGPIIPQKLEVDTCTGSSRERYSKFCSQFDEPVSQVKCGGQCTGPSQCNGDCICVASQSEVSAKQASQGVWGSGIKSFCLSLGIAMLKGKGTTSRTRYDQDLGRRGLGSDRDRSNGFWACPCNQSYIAQACCEGSNSLARQDLLSITAVT